MSETAYLFLKTKPMNISDFYTLETPPSSSTSKDSTDESLLSFHSKTKYKFLITNVEEQSNNPSICSTSKSNEITNSIILKDDEFGNSLYIDMHTPLRRTLGNTKLKTRQDVRRFRKFLKRNYDLSSLALIDIHPDTMRTYLIDYLTSIRTRKGLQYDPETLRSYYLSIQRFLKDSNYPYCLRNSPQFAECRDLIIKMRKEKSQIKLNDISSKDSTELTNKRLTKKKLSTIESTNETRMNFETEKHNDQPSSSDTIVPIASKNCFLLTKDLLPSSSLPPRKRQQMKYFLEFGSPNDFILLPKVPLLSTPSFILSSDAYSLLVKFTHISSSFIVLSSTNSSSHRCTHHFEQLLDESPACGNVQRLMLTTLCHEWTGDIRLVHDNLRPELSSFLPHILVLNILSSKYSY